MILVYGFQFLNLSDLARSAGAYFQWWSVIKRNRLMEKHKKDWKELDLLGTGKLYRVILCRTFRNLWSLNLASMQLSNCHFKWWWRLLQLWNVWIFQTFPHWTISLFSKSRNFWWNYSILQNWQCTVHNSGQRVFCFCQELETSEARGLEFSAEECTKTFDSVGSSRLQIEPEEGHNPLNVVNTF